LVSLTIVSLSMVAGSLSGLFAKRGLLSCVFGRGSMFDDDVLGGFSWFWVIGISVHEVWLFGINLVFFNWEGLL
jgi:hypothetical protein